MTHIVYVNGFFFSDNWQHVVLIQKARPSFLKGRWTGVGGHVEEGEQAHTAMVREFQEETGLLVPAWTKFAVIHNAHYTMNMFFAQGDVDSVDTITDETVDVWAVEAVRRASPQGLAPNSRWLMEMALNMGRGNNSDATFFNITVSP